MRSIFVLLLFVFCSSAMAAPCSKADVAPLLNKMFSSLGHDCKAYASLFSADGQYFHQHDGYKSAAELPKNCEDYAKFCPGNECRFLQSGEALTVSRSGYSCEILVPYLWSEIPANKRANGNLEPHTGWEYIVATPASGSSVGYTIKRFAELETTYSVAFNWSKPDDTPAVVAESTLRLLALPNSASKGECNNPVAPILTQHFDAWSSGGNVWRQQGDAVVLAAGGICHVEVPYSAQVGTTLKTGHFVFTLQPLGNTYRTLDAVEFSQAVL